MAQAHTIATLGSHSSLQILKGAKDEGFPTLLITLANRADFYRQFPFIDECISIDDYSKFNSLESDLLAKKAILIPHGSFVAYLGVWGNKQLKVPYFGNKQVLTWEASRHKQLKWMQKAQLRLPHILKPGDHIDRSVIVKSYGASGGTGYFVAHNQKEFTRKIIGFAKRKYIIQEYIIGVPMYLHFFYSPLNKSLELLSVDRRYETNVDSLGRLPLTHQQSMDITPSFVVVGNSPLTLRESLLPEAYAMAERVVAASQQLVDHHGLYGPFCIETVITPDQKFYTIELSCRIVAGTNLFIKGSPYSDLLYDEPMSTGRRIAREIKLAIKQNKLNLILN